MLSKRTMRMTPRTEAFGFESLEDRRMMTQVPELLANATFCSDPVIHTFQDEPAAYFSGNGRSGCGSRLDFEGLWRTDGTADGTFAVATDLAEYIYPESLIEVRDKLYFNVLTGGKLVEETYETDGTPSGTRKFKEAWTVALMNFNDHMLITCQFVCADNFNGGQLIAYDGETERTLSVYDFDSPPGSTVHRFDHARLGDSVFFGGDHLWRLGNIDDGIEQFLTLDDPIIGVRIIGITSEEELYFWATDSGANSVWVSDGTRSGTSPVEGDQLTGPSASIWNDALLVANQESLFIVNGDEATLLMQRNSADTIQPIYDWNGQAVLASKSELIVTDGTAEGTSRIHETTSADYPYSSDRMFHTAKHLYFEMPGFRENGNPIYRSDGSQAQFISRDSKILSASNKSIFYRGEDGDIWMLVDDETEPVRFADHIGVNATEVHTSLGNGMVLFSGVDDGEIKFWVTDGTVAGTRVLGEYVPTQVGDEIETSLLGLERFFRVEDRIIFQANYLDGHHDGDNRIYSLIAPVIDGQLPGDIDGDGVVAFTDFLILSSNFGNSDATEKNGDIDDDGVVTFADFLVLSKNFGRKA